MINAFDYSEDKIINAARAYQLSAGCEDSLQVKHRRDMMLAMSAIESASLSGRFNADFVLMRSGAYNYERVKMVVRALEDLGYDVDVNDNSSVGCYITASWANCK